MLLSKIKCLYDILPKECLKFLRYIPDRILFGPSYTEAQKKISFDKALIDKNLFDTLNYVREHTQFGREHIPEQFALKDVHTVLESLPLIDSYDIGHNLDYYTSDEFSTLNSYKTTTGGTGGPETTILHSDELFGREWAYVHNIWEYAGYNRTKDMKLTLRGKCLKEDKLVEYNPVYNELIVDTFKINGTSFKFFLDEFKKYEINYIYGYPSLVKEFMSYFEQYNYIPKLKGVLLVSEGASVADKKNIADFFGTKVISFYGQSERALIAVDLEMTGLYKVYTSYGFPRVVNGELVVTAFVNRVLPLINYKIGDGAEIIEDENNIYLQNLIGRSAKDFIYLSKEKRIPVTSVNTHSLTKSEILYYQIHQKRFAEVEIRVLQKQTSTMPAEKLLETFGNEIRSKLKDFDVNIRMVNKDEIVKSHRGKTLQVVQELKV